MNKGADITTVAVRDDGTERVKVTHQTERSGRMDSLQNDKIELRSLLLQRT